MYCFKLRCHACKGDKVSSFLHYKTKYIVYYPRVKVNVLIFRIYYTLRLDRPPNNRKKNINKPLLLRKLGRRTYCICFGGFKLVRYTLLYKRVSRAKWLGLLLLLPKTTETIVWTRQYTEEWKLKNVTLMIFIYLV